MVGTIYLRVADQIQNNTLLIDVAMYIITIDRDFDRMEFVETPTFKSSSLESAISSASDTFFYASTLT